MSGNLHLFFPSGERVVALPGWQNPRLYLPARCFASRWGASSLYPASTPRGQLYRFLLRIRAATGLIAVRTVHSSVWPLGAFVREVLPRAAAAAVLVGTPGPSQKLTVRLQDEKNRTLGYLKYAEQVVARQRLQQEYKMLSSIPDGLGPEPLKYGAMGAGEALLITPIEGTKLPATLPPAGGVSEFLNSLSILPPVPLDTHPWVRRTSKQGAQDLASCFEVLAGKDWPVVIQHGDFTPWNLLRRSDGSVGAIDWEWGTLEAFPHLDLASYILLTSALIYRRAPTKAAEYAVRYLTRQPQLGLSRMETRALIRITAYDIYQRSSVAGLTPENIGLRKWWRTVWKSEAWHV